LSVKKIAITGHNHGIGQALANNYKSQGHDVIGLSRSTGYDIKLEDILDPIKDCDILINNAHDEFGQVQLLHRVFNLWQHQSNKQIINISSAITMYPIPANLHMEEYQYRLQKVCLEEAVNQLRLLENGPRLILVKPGAVATYPSDASTSANADVWASSLINSLNAIDAGLEIAEITLVTRHSTLSSYKD
jgi:NADP-dependent 3-hydroxy acid dehydrogenase YdfG